MKIDHSTHVARAMANPKISAVVHAAQEHMQSKHSVAMSERQVIELLDHLERTMREAAAKDALERIILAMFGNDSVNRSH